MMSSYNRDDEVEHVKELRRVILAPSRGVALMPSRSYDQVVRGILIGDIWSALDARLLRSESVVAVLNSCYDVASSGGRYWVDTNADYYRRRGLDVMFLGVPATDASWYPLDQWFSIAADFIERSLRHGTVLIHCIQGMSRSATLVAAFLMIKRHMSASQALCTLRYKREIFPNDGFLRQLYRLERQLNSSRSRSFHHSRLGLWF